MRPVPRLLWQPRRVPAHPVTNVAARRRAAADRAETDPLEPALGAFVYLYGHRLAPAAAQCIDQRRPPIATCSHRLCNGQPGQLEAQSRLAQAVDSDQLTAVEPAKDDTVRISPQRGDCRRGRLYRTERGAIGEHLHRLPIEFGRQQRPTRLAGDGGVTGPRGLILLPSSRLAVRLAGRPAL